MACIASGYDVEGHQEQHHRLLKEKLNFQASKSYAKSRQNHLKSNFFECFSSYNDWMNFNLQSFPTQHDWGHDKNHLSGLERCHFRIASAKFGGRNGRKRRPQAMHQAEQHDSSIITTYCLYFYDICALIWIFKQRLCDIMRFAMRLWARPPAPQFVCPLFPRLLLSNEIKEICDIERTRWCTYIDMNTHNENKCRQRSNIERK